MRDISQDFSVFYESHIKDIATNIIKRDKVNGFFISRQIICHVFILAPIIITALILGCDCILKLDLILEISDIVNIPL